MIDSSDRKYADRGLVYTGPGRAYGLSATERYTLDELMVGATAQKSVVAYGTGGDTFVIQKDTKRIDRWACEDGRYHFSHTCNELDKSLRYRILSFQDAEEIMERTATFTPRP